MRTGAGTPTDPPPLAGRNFDQGEQPGWNKGEMEKLGDFNKLSTKSSKNRYTEYTSFEKFCTKDGVRPKDYGTVTFCNNIWNTLKNQCGFTFKSPSNLTIDIRVSK